MLTQLSPSHSPSNRGRLSAALLFTFIQAACITPGEGAMSEEERQELENIAVEIQSSAAEGPSSEGASHWHIPVGFQGTGLAIGNPREWTGVRLNFADHDVDEIRGVNASVWSWKTPSVKEMKGLGLGLKSRVVNGHGVSLGVLDTTAEDSFRGLQVGGGAVVVGGESRGLSIGGLAAVAGSDTRGLSASGLAVVTGGTQRGVHLAGLANVAAKDSSGLSLAGLASVTLGDRTGVHAGGLAVVSLGDARGFSTAGLGNVSQGAISGIALGGLATVAAHDIDGLAVSGLSTAFGGSFTGIGLGGLTVGDSESTGIQNPFGGPLQSGSYSSATGLMLAGYKVQASEITGVTGALVNRTNFLTGLAVGGMNRVTGTQTGLSIGLFNQATMLDGVQIGLLNHVAENPWWARWLPLVNARF